MSPRLVANTLAVSAALAGFGAVATTAHAADNTMKVCGAKYQAAKANKTLPAGETWMQFLAQCRGGTPAHPAAVAAAHTAPAPAPAPASGGFLSRLLGGRTSPAAPAPAPVSVAAGGGKAAMVGRERQCGAEWRAAKAAGKTPAGQTWPQYWSQCNARLKH